MVASLTYFDPQPTGFELPARMPSPFAPGTPHALAARAVERLRAELAAGLADRMGLARDGKMFGVLVVEDGGGRIGWLRAFSGMVGHAWELPGFVGPAFDAVARDAFWIAGERELITIADQIAAVDRELAPIRAELAALVAAQVSARAELDRRHRAARDARHATRAEIEERRRADRKSSRANAAADSDRESSGANAAADQDDELSGSNAAADIDRESSGANAAADLDKIAQLDRESSRASAELAQHRRAARAARVAIAARVDALVERRTALDAERTAKSRDFLVRIHDTYALPNARGEVAPLRALFAPAEPPGGAGDCAAPKLLAHAYRAGLRPIVLAEFWCGAPPATGDRRDGAFYPACHGKCGPILAHMLEGLDAEPRPAFGEDAIDSAAPYTLFEDAWLAVIRKPAGLLSVPGRSSKADSVLARLRVRYPDATGPLLPHRLDLDTSGVMLVAKDLATHGSLQRQFSERTITKRYIAILDGEPRADAGTVELPLRVDLDDRPRQIVDPVHGRWAVTQWHVLHREAGRTRVALHPGTGRAHQLRVHAAHPSGIGVPIVGDRLYGRAGGRLLLHAEAMTLVHPHTHQRLTFEDPAPF